MHHDINEIFLLKSDRFFSFFFFSILPEAEKSDVGGGGGL